MKSFIRNSLTSNPGSRKKRLALTLLVSFCLTYMDQAFAMPMACMMSADEMKSPCNQMMTKVHNVAQGDFQQAASDMTASQSMLMDCCDIMNSVNSSDDCACPDGGCAATLSILNGFSNSLRLLSEPAHYYSITGFSSQINSALFRPPIA